MASIWIELPYGYDANDIKQFLTDHKLTHLKSHGEYWVRVGDALKSDKGVIARVMEAKRNEVGEPHICIANKNLTKEELTEQFDTDHSYVSQHAPQGMHYGTDRYGNTGYFEDFEQSIGE